MTTSLTMQITNIPGDGSVGGDDAFDLLSMSLGATATVGNPGSGSGTGKASLSSVTVTLEAYNVPLLLRWLVTGRHERRVTLVATQSTTSGTGHVTPTQTIVLDDAQLSLCQESFTVGAANPIVELTIEYARIKYTQQSNPPVSFSWDRQGNAPI